MPEPQECLTQSVYLNTFIQQESENGPLAVKGFFCDSTAAEDMEANGKADTDTDKLDNDKPHFHIQRLPPDSTRRRGGSGMQGPILPPPEIIPRSDPALDSDFEDLVLEATIPRPRSLVLKFKRLLKQVFLMAHLMTHTLVQIYNPLQWYESVCKVSKYRRGFKVPFAIDLGTWIIAFTSLDGLSTPRWSLKPPSTISILDNKEAWLAGFVRWHACLGNWCNSNDSLFDFIVALKHIFMGLGVYTVSEILAKAGLHPLWRPGEVFGNPSRTSRLILAYADYIFKALQNAMTCISGCHSPAFGYLLYQTAALRERYMRTTFVYGRLALFKSTTIASIQRHNQAVLERLETAGRRFQRDPEAGFYDIWTAECLSHEAFALRDLIYGVWTKGKYSTTDLESMIPLAKNFALIGALQGPSSTYLHPDAATPSSTLAALRTHAFRQTTTAKATTIWSLYMNLSHLSVSWDTYRFGGKQAHQRDLLKAGEPRPFNSVTLSQEEQKDASPSSKIANREVFVLGPTDYTSTAKLIERGWKREILVCKWDPQAHEAALEAYNHSRLVKTAKATTGLAARKDKELAELDPTSLLLPRVKANKRAVDHKMEVAEAARAKSWTDRGVHDTADDVTEVVEVPASKKRRISADRSVVMGRAPDDTEDPLNAGVSTRSGQRRKRVG